MHIDNGEPTSKNAQLTEIADPFISIIITCYNYEKYIRECIESALAQDYSHFEILVVNDGSTDRSLEVISEYSDKVTIVSTPNQGFIKTCLLGLSKSRGTHIIFLDADDKLRPNLLSRAMEYLKRPEVSKVQVMMQPIDEEGAEIREPFPNLDKNIAQDYFRKCVIKNGCYLTPPTSGNIYRRDVYENVGDISYDFGIDGVAYLFAAFCGDVIHISEVLAYYRVHGSNMSSQKGLSADGFQRNADIFVHRMRHLKELVQSHRNADLDFEVGNHYQYVIEALSYADTMSGRRISIDRAVSFFNGRATRIPSKRDLSMTALILSLSILPRSKAQKLVAMRYRK
ncbi:glycosyltransferase family 2 protein [Methylobacterium komagatae]